MNNELDWWKKQHKVVKALLCSSVYGNGAIYDTLTPEQIIHIYNKCKL